MNGKRSKSGFTLVELLVAVVIVATLGTLTAATFVRMRDSLRLVRAHHDLREVMVAIQLYRNDHHGVCPPTRFSCSTGAVFPLPVELLDYGLPAGEGKFGQRAVAMADAFRSDAGYRYRAVGPAIMNESVRVADGSKLWVPEGFPSASGIGGRYQDDPRSSPVLFAVWSAGPDPEAALFDVPGRLPLPQRYWMKRAGDPGVVMQARAANGEIITSQ
jgi:prepilin-type N-terminal cleavage/methylation domain-containing protein